ncbi:unnamed protein product [Amaranthus hypochondriacus]
MTPLQAHRPSWISRWDNIISKPESTGDSTPLICYKEENMDNRGRLKQNVLTMENGTSKGAEEIKTRLFHADLTEKPGNFGNKISNLLFPTRNLFQNQQKAAAFESEGDHEFDHNSMALALTIGNEGTSRDFKFKSNVQPAMSHLYEHKGKAMSRSHTYDKTDASKPVVVFERHFSNDNFTCFNQDGCKYQKSSSILFHEKKLENDLCHKSGPSDEHFPHDCLPSKKNFQSFFLKKQSPGQPLNRVPCSFRNVETMRICTMVDSVENSPGDPPKISQRAHHILFTKETCVNLSKGHQMIGKPSSDHREENTFDGSFSTSPKFHSTGVKIRPLWTSTDSEEKENTGNPSCCKASSGNEASAETNGMLLRPNMADREEKTFDGYFSMSPNVASQERGVKTQSLWNIADSEEKGNIGNPSTCIVSSRNEASAETDGLRVGAPKRRHIFLGTGSSPLTKDDTMEERNPPAPCDSSTNKDRSKRPITEIPDINEELPGIQPAVSSTDGNGPSTSRVHSLNTKQLFSCHEQTSKPESTNTHQVRSGPDASNRWIKRLKLNSDDSFGIGTKSSDMGEGSSNEKFSMFFNKIMKCNRESLDAKLRNYHGKEHMAIDQNVESIRSGDLLSVGSRKRNRSVDHGCSWIQRWCCTASTPSKPKPLVICEPHSLKLGQDELAKEQFPSIGAMALMGKAMNGFKSCEFTKRGPVVVWNTKEY